MEIKQIVEKYRISLCEDGRLKVFIPKKEIAKASTEIKEKRPQIVEYLQQKKADEQALIVRRKKAEEVASAIPGVRELRAARAQANKSHAALAQAIEKGDGILPVEGVDVEALKKLEQNENAVFVLELHSKYEYMANYELWTIAQECFLMFADGATVEEVKAEFDRKNEEFCQQHAWD